MKPGCPVGLWEHSMLKLTKAYPGKGKPQGDSHPPTIKIF